jgi:hypothetical protein
MFQFAVIGPLLADRLGVVRQCIECRSALGLNAPPCPGFGPGCLVTPHANPLDASQIRAAPGK